ncbi:hypothetical protein OHC33_001573 [Knufia fluminis]|uniref:Uncharacterized protein n=1 Tax=Knufia fluminis TaxID=191047 RepID=A0AAN8IRH7_9EURO|nr:hypothetical protein OHC33_001573 [Knufia fluminis]
MPTLGRFSNRYGELDAGSRLAYHAGVIDASSPLLDIANVEFGKARIRCLLEPEGKKWGIYKRKRAAIIHLQIKADQPSGCNISNFQLELCFAPVAQASTNTSTAGSRYLLRSTTSHQPLVSLVKLPSPLYVSGRPCADHSRREWSFHPGVQTTSIEGSLGGARASLPCAAQTAWVFRSSCDADTKGRLVTASWIWETDSRNPQAEGNGVLHAGIALNHPGEPFVVACQAKGNVRKARFRLKFSSKNKEAQPRLWRLIPEASNEDLKEQIDGLESLMVKLNILASTPAPQTPQQYSGCPSSRSYGSAMIGGAATVHMGDVHYTFAGSQQKVS